MRTSIGQAAANALAAWLTQSLSKDVKCYAHWPNGSVQLKGREVSIIPVGRRVRVEGYGAFQVAGRVNLSPTMARVQVRDGDLTQHMQVDVWADSYAGRDDVIAQLDDALHAGRAETLNIKNSVQSIQSDPYNDELALWFAEDSEFTGNICTFQFDEFVIDDDPDAVQRCEYRATGIGESRMPNLVSRTVPRLVKATWKQKVTESTTPTVFDTSTLTAGTPPTVTRGHSTS